MYHDKKSGQWLFTGVTEDVAKDVHVPTHLRESVVIKDCRNTKFRISLRCTYIRIENCENLQVEVNSVLGTVDIIHCKGFLLTCEAIVPTVIVSGSHRGTIFLEAGALRTDVVSTRSTEINLAWKNSTEEGLFVEKQLPEQFVHSVQNDDIVTTVSTSYLS